MDVILFWKIFKISSVISANKSKTGHAFPSPKPSSSHLTITIIPSLQAATTYRNA